MGQALGPVLPIAVVIALSPMAIVAVVLMLVTERGKVNGAAFLAGWALGIVVVGGALLAVASTVDTTDSDGPATWVSWLTLVFGVLLLLLGAKQWRGRPRGDAEGEMPKWMSALDSFGPGKAAGTAFFLAGINPKNLLLIVAADAAIVGADTSTAAQAVVFLLFVIIASLGVAIPVGIAVVMGERSAELLEGLKTWMAHNNAVIMAVLLLIIGVKLLGDGIAGLS